MKRHTVDNTFPFTHAKCTLLETHKLKAKINNTFVTLNKFNFRNPLREKRSNTENNSTRPWMHHIETIKTKKYT